MRVTLTYLVMHLLSALVVGFTAWRLVKERPRVWIRLLLPAGAVIFLADALFLSFRPDWVVALVPHADAIFLANIQLEALALMLCGSLGSSQRVWMKLRIVAMVIAALIALRYTNAYHFAPMAQTGRAQVVDHDIVIQTSEETCSAAGTATMLRLLGIKTTESEMARLCLTRKDLGTPPLGIYRGLSKKVGSRGWQVHVFQCRPEELPEMPKPCLISVEFRPDRLPGERLLSYLERSWAKSEGHTVVYLGHDHNGTRHRIADPASGIHSWDDRDLHALFSGTVYVITGPSAGEPG